MELNGTPPHPTIDHTFERSNLVQVPQEKNAATQTEILASMAALSSDSVTAHAANRPSKGDSRLLLSTTRESCNEIRKIGEKANKLSVTIKCKHIVNKNADATRSAVIFQEILRNFVIIFDKHKNPLSCIADRTHIGTAQFILAALSNLLEKTTLPTQQRSILWSDTNEAFTSRISTKEICYSSNIDLLTQLIISAHAADTKEKTIKSGFGNLIAKVFQAQSMMIFLRLVKTLHAESSEQRLLKILENLTTLIDENLESEARMYLFLQLMKAIRQHPSERICKMINPEIREIHTTIDGYYAYAFMQTRSGEKSTDDESF